MRVVKPVIIDEADLTSNVAIDDFTEWASGTTYAEGDKVRISSELGTWESLENSNTGSNPMTTDNRVSESPSWLYLGRVNRWKMFDEYLQSQTENAEEIDVTIAAQQISDSLVLMEVEAFEVEVTVTHAVEGIVYNETYAMADYLVDDYYEYFFEPYLEFSDLKVVDMMSDLALPPYDEVDIRVQIREDGATVKCGKLVLGYGFDIGQTKYGPRLSIIDYSKKITDEFGRTYMSVGAFARRSQIDLHVKNDRVDWLYRRLADLRAQPLVWIGDPRDGGFSSMSVYGFYRDFEIIIPGPAMSSCSLEIEGMI